MSVAVLPVKCKQRPKPKKTIDEWTPSDEVMGKIYRMGMSLALCRLHEACFRRSKKDSKSVSFDRHFFKYCRARNYGSYWFIATDIPTWMESEPINREDGSWLPSQIVYDLLIDAGFTGDHIHAYAAQYAQANGKSMFGAEKFFFDTMKSARLPRDDCDYRRLEEIEKRNKRMIKAGIFGYQSGDLSA